MYLYRWNISTSTYNTNTMMWLVWSQLRYLHYLHMYITCISKTSAFILTAPIHLGKKSRSTDKYNDNYTCIHWTKSVYNIHKLNWNDIQKMLTKLIIFVNTREYLLNPGGILISTIMWTQRLLFLCSVVCRCYFYPILNALHSQNVMTQLL